ncbi:MAG: ABC transporter substrate-binding protein [Acidimicrobiales bacterium]
MARKLKMAMAMGVLVSLIAASCGNSKGSNASKPGAKVAAPTDGGQANRNKKEAISGVPGVDDKTISYALVGTKTNNPLGTCLLDCYRQGVDAYFAYRNSQGGIYGRKLVVGQALDDALGKNQDVNLGVISGGKAFGTFQVGLLQQGWGSLDDAGVPTYTWGIDATSAANRQAIFPSTVIPCPDCTRRVVPYAAMEVGAKKAGVLGYATSQTSQVCADSTAESFKQYASDTGVEFAYLKDDLNFGLPDGLGPQVTAMKKAGVDFIATCFDLNAMKTLAQELKRQGMSKVILFHPNTYDRKFVADNADLFDGDFVSVQFRPFEADARGSALDQFKTWMARAKSPLTELAMVGWINATLAYDGLLAAGPKFDRAKVLAATNAITDFTADGLVSTVDWTIAHKPYTQATRAKADDQDCSTLVKVVDGKFQVVGDGAKPWLCWKRNSTRWALPKETNFK